MSEELQGLEGTVPIDEAILIPHCQIFPNEWNPNSQSDATFSHLVAEIQEDGFQTPLVVVPWVDHPGSTEEKPHYKIIEGEHRWKAGGLLDMEKLPCFVNTTWDEEAQKIKTVRRNQLSGTLDDQKFTALIASLTDAGIDKADLPRLMAFEDDLDFVNHLLEMDAEPKEVDKSSWLEDGATDEVAKEIEAIDGISDILNHIFSNYGSEVQQNFIFFSHKGKTHLMVMSDKDLFDQIEKMVGNLRESKKNINDHLREIFQIYDTVMEEGLSTDDEA